MEHGQVFLVHDGISKLIYGHVGSAPRPIHREEPQSDGSQVEGHAVVQAQQLVCLLGGRIHVARVVGGGRQPERNRRLLAVYAGA